MIIPSSWKIQALLLRADHTVGFTRSQCPVVKHAFFVLPCAERDNLLVRINQTVVINVLLLYSLFG
jgi:hypothetical protein